MNNKPNKLHEDFFEHKSTPLTDPVNFGWVAVSGICVFSSFVALCALLKQSPHNPSDWITIGLLGIPLFGGLYVLTQGWKRGISA